MRRNAITGAIVAALFAVLVGVVYLLSNKNDNKSAAKTTTSTAAAATTTTTTPLPAGCVATKPQAANVTRTFSKAPAMTVNKAKKYSATISTSCGTVVVALDAAHAPKGVNNFVFLAQHHFYDGLTWHRVVKDFVVQGGDPKGDGTGGPGYSVVTETPASGYKQGTIAYAKSASEANGTAGSQFFIVSGSSISALNQKTNGAYQYGAFGQVSKGLDAVKKLQSLVPS